ncbi:9533_t:CDS:2, partial [Entrophospora sp. SA101]
QKIEEDRIAHQAAETSRQETILKVVSQTLSTNTAKLLETTVRNEIQINVLPSLSKMVNSAIDKHVHRGITEAMNKSIPNTIEKSISDQIQRMLAKNAVIEPIAKGVSKTIKPVIEENFRDYFENIIVPTFEKSTNSMFDQITSMLESGLRDISISTTTPQSSSTTVLHDQNATNNITRLQTSVDHLTLQVQQLQQFLQSQQLITNLTTRHVEHNHHELSSKQLPHAVSADRLLEMGNYDDAFATILATHDLQSILRLCSKVNPSVIFDSSSNLVSQPVILSLVHHLSMDLHKYQEFKLNWLEETIIKLNPKDPLIKDHSERILPTVKQRLEERYFQVDTQDSNDPTLKSISFLVRVLNNLTV